jgi:hypothetical protein
MVSSRSAFLLGPFGARPPDPLRLEFVAGFFLLLVFFEGGSV